MTCTSMISEAADFIRARISIAPKIALILGSGLGGSVDELEERTVIPYADIPHWPTSTTIGHAGQLVAGRMHGIPVIVMQGRLHYYEGHTMESVIFPVRVLRRLGADSLVATNASGAIDLGLKPMDLVAVYDHINHMGVNPLTGANDDELGPRFPDMTYAYDPEYLDLLDKAAHDAGVEIKRGVYIAFSGPSYETPAEIRMARAIGADVVGMSTVPEVIAANHMGMRVAVISCVANYAAGISPDRLSGEEVVEVMGRASDKMTRLLGAFVKEIA